MTKPHRYLAALLTAAALVTSQAGCSRPESFQGTLVLWEPPRWPVAGDTSRWTRDRVAAFEREHPGVKVEFKTYPQSELEGALDDAWKAGQGPDVALAPFRPDWAADGRLQALDALLPADVQKDFIPATLDAARLDGTLYGLPAGAEPSLLVLNLDAFAVRGVTPPADGRWTLDEFEKTLRALSGKAGDRQVYGLGYYVLPGFHEFWPLWTAGEPLLDPATGSLQPDREPIRQAIARLGAWTREPGLLWPGSAQSGPDDLWQAFSGSAASVAMAPWGPWSLPLLRQGQFQSRVAVAHFPSVGGRSATTGVVHTYLLRAQPYALKARAALDLALFLTDAPAQKEQARNTGILPVRASAGNPFPEDVALTQALTLVPEMVPLPADRKRVEDMDRLQQRVQYALLGALTPEEAVGRGERSSVTP
ncbi:MAG: ABC transporter substrate-binding protein [Bacillota bacterium]